VSACAADASPPDRGVALGTPPWSDRVADHLYAVDLVIEHGSEIGLTAEQTEEIQADLERTRRAWDEAASRLTAASAELSAILDRSPIEEAAAARAAERVTRVEAELKQLHLGLLVRVKNALRPDQRTRLDSLRVRAAHPPG
jgi:Spy/CpxP family protein refolding chaperone